MLKRITRQEKANEAAEAWRARYGPWGPKDRRKVVYDKLCELGPNPNPDDVDRVIGNGSWTASSYCDECGKESDVVIRVGQEPGHDSATVVLCPSCLKQACVLIEPQDLSPPHEGNRRPADTLPPNS